METRYEKQCPGCKRMKPAQAYEEWDKGKLVGITRHCSECIRAGKHLGKREE